jgi:hypothetical protein
MTQEPAIDAPEGDDGFVPRIVYEFGLKWAQLAAFSGLIFTLFGLDKWLNGGAWTLASICALGSVYAFRRAIRTGFPATTLLSLTCLAIYLVIIISVAMRYGPPPDVLQRNRVPGSLLLGYGVMTAFAVIILAYRRQETLFGGKYPQAIQNAIARCIVDQACYRQNQEWHLLFRESGPGNTSVVMTLTYELVNRTTRPLEQTLYLTPMRPAVRFIEASAGDIAFDVNDPRNRSAAGLQIPVEVGPAKVVPVRLSAEVAYWPSDSDLFASYLASTDLSLVVSNALPNVDVFVEVLATTRINSVQLETGRVWALKDGILPYQGFKVDWFQRAPGLHSVGSA